MLSSYLQEPQNIHGWGQTSEIYKIYIVSASVKAEAEGNDQVAKGYKSRGTLKEPTGIH